MIPDLEDIIDRLVAGATTREQALTWLGQHLQLAAGMGDDAGVLDGFAMSVIEGLHAQRGMLPDQSIKPSCEYAYRVALQMMAARAGWQEADDKALAES